MPYLVKYYRSIRNSGDMSFNVDRAAKLELECWIVHRERTKHARKGIWSVTPGDVIRQHATAWMVQEYETKMWK